MLEALTTAPFSILKSFILVALSSRLSGKNDSVSVKFLAADIAFPSLGNLAAERISGSLINADVKLNSGFNTFTVKVFEKGVWDLHLNTTSEICSGLSLKPNDATRSLVLSTARRSGSPRIILYTFT